MIRTGLRLVAIVLTTLVSFADAKTPATQPLRAGDKKPLARHVLLIGLDGARPDAIRDHAGPAVRSLIDNGTSCWQAQAVKPTVTQVNWASVLTGCGPDTHGITQRSVTEEQLAAIQLKAPTLFDLVAQAGQPAAGFLGHWKLYPNETKTSGAVTFRSSYESVVVGGAAAKYIVANKPAFCFVYIGDLDGLGHRHGWMSPKYLDGVKVVDRAVQKLLDALDQAGIRDDTIVMLTSDHGGHDKSHGQGTSEDLTIPWIASGPGVARGVTIERAISTIDTAPTVLAALGLDVPSTVEGMPVRELFGEPAVPPAALAMKPTVRSASGAATRPVAGDATRGSRVLIISVDGLRPDLALLADMPTMRGLLKEGAYTFWARTTEVALTLPSHTSMVTGVTPERHGITWNDDDPKQGLKYPNYPTLFGLARKAGYSTALVGGKSKFNALTEPGTLDYPYIPGIDENSRRNDDVATRAAALIASKKPQVMMVHFGDVDRAGHATGWAAPDQMQAIESADAAIGKVLSALRAAGEYDNTLIILTADHGGYGRTHGKNDDRSAFIPWIAVGPGIRKGFDLTRIKDLQVRTEDTFATACHFLALTPAPDIDGHWVELAFEKTELLKPIESGRAKSSQSSP